MQYYKARQVLRKSLARGGDDIEASGQLSVSMVSQPHSGPAEPHCSPFPHWPWLFPECAERPHPGTWQGHLSSQSHLPRPTWLYQCLLILQGSAASLHPGVGWAPLVCAPTQVLSCSRFSRPPQPLASVSWPPCEHLRAVP